VLLDVGSMASLITSATAAALAAACAVDDMLLEAHRLLLRRLLLLLVVLSAQVEEVVSLSDAPPWLLSLLLLLVWVLVCPVLAGALLQRLSTGLLLSRPVVSACGVAASSTVRSTNHGKSCWTDT
jgi:hypothetical protein